MTLKQQLVEAMEKSDVQEIKKEERTLAEIEDISAKLGNCPRSIRQTF